MSDINNVLSILDAINKENTLSFYVPSLKKQVQFKGFNTGQQKALLKAAIDNPVFQTRFIIAVYNIINENCLEREVISALTNIDVVAILLQYRINIYGNSFVVKQDGTEYTVNLQDCIENAKAVTVPTSTTIQNGLFTVKVGPPTLTEQYLLEKQIREKTLSDKDLINPTDINLSETIGDAFSGEVSKYIKEITVVRDGQEQGLGHKAFQFTKKIALLEKIPTAVVKDVLAYVVKVTAAQKQITQIQGVNIDTNKTEQVTVPVDSTLFTLE